MPLTKVDPFKDMIQSAFHDITPVRLRLLFVANCLCALVFCLVAVFTVQQHEHAVKTIGHDAAPSVTAAHQIKIGAEMMDVDLANELLLAPGQDQAKEMAADFEQWRQKACKQLVAAAKNITYGASEQTPIESILIALGQFDMQAQSALDMHNAGDTSNALNSYHNAYEIMQQDVLPNADALNRANSKMLEAAYWQEESESALSSGLVLAIGIILVLLLITTQVYLRLRFRRKMNPPLLIATLCLIAFVPHLYTVLRENSDQLKIAKEDAYDSIVALLDARADAYEANAAESRWLLDRKQADAHQKRFFEKLSAVASFAPGHNYAETLELAERQLSAGEKYNLSGFSGSLADEFKNVRFEGEGEAALEALQALSNYSDVDSKMRQLEKSGDHVRSVEIGLGYEPGASNFHFTKLDDALDRLIKINEEHFQHAVEQAAGDLSGLILLSQLLSLLIITCAYLGLRPRMAEYMK